MSSVMEIAMRDMGQLIEMANANMKYLPGPILNVGGFGAVADGETDCTDIVQMVIDEAIASGQRTIFFPHGNTGQYYVTALTNADQVDFIGDNCSFVGGYSGTIQNLGGVAELKADITQRAINIKYPPIPMVGCKCDGVTDDLAQYQAIVDAVGMNGGGNVFQPPGTTLIEGTLYYHADNVHIFGAGAASILRCNTPGVTMIAADEDTHTLGVYTYFRYCSLKDIAVYSEQADVGIDFSGFSYSEFRPTYVQLKGNNKKCFMGKGNQGSAPYYNRFSMALVGGDNAPAGTTGSVCFSFEPGAWTGGSNGPNSNIIESIGRAISADYVIDLQSGNGNLIGQISGESIVKSYFRFNFLPSSDTGTSTGGGTRLQLIDTSKAWTTNQFTNYFVEITGGTGVGQVRRISSNTATTLTLDSSGVWNIKPDATSTYAIYASRAIGNKIRQYRVEGTSGCDLIRTYPGARKNSVKEGYVSSLGAGKFVSGNDWSLYNDYVDGDRVSYMFWKNDVAASLTDVYLNPERGTAYYQGGIAPGGEFFVPASVTISCTNQTAGEAIITVEFGNSLLSVTGKINADNRWWIQIPISGFVQVPSGDKIKAKVTTDGSWAPATADLSVTVEGYIMA